MEKLAIPFNKPNLTGKETHYIYDAVYGQGQLAGNGKYTKLCQQFFEDHYGFHKCLLTTSCTDALEMCALLLDLKEGDEVIMPSYTFVSTANAFALRGATIRFADSLPTHPNIDPTSIKELLNEKTKAIVVVHYAGVACDMDEIMAIAKQHNIYVVEDAAQAIESYYNGKPLGSIGHLAAFSFHETKNVISGEGGMLVINDVQFVDRAEILWEKGTNRNAFFRGEVHKYGWVDIGSSFLPSELTAAFLYAQLEAMQETQAKRKALWKLYHEKFTQKITEKNNLQSFSNSESVQIALPYLPEKATNNAHMFYLVFPSIESRTEAIAKLKELGIQSVFHYLPLHSSEYFTEKHDGRNLSWVDKYADCLLRLPFHMDVNQEIVEKIVDTILGE